MKTAVLVALALLVIVAAAALYPARPYMDFQVLYHADLGLLRGIPIYDHEGQVRMIAALADVSTSQVFVMPFPYPPWYSLSTIWLARLSIETAARIWFGLNLAMFAAAVWLLMREQSLLKGWLAGLAGLLWLPVSGSLLVGQFVFPCLLGAALLIYALQSNRPVLVAVAAVLLTFKPHLGIPLLLAAFACMASQKWAITRSALTALLIAAMALFLLGFIASPQWPIQYMKSLAGFSSVSGVTSCEQCVSLSTILAHATGGGLQRAVLYSGVLVVSSGAWLILRRGVIFADPARAVAATTLAVLVASPYLLNYDYVLLLIPFIEVARHKLGATSWATLATAYALPFIGLGLWGTAGNLSVLASTFIVLVMTLMRHGELNSDPA